ncbi:MAG TPA: hypothetical protein VD815_00950 [Candidatus Saccharimonadales bacterium]|nr:hypothetical protein [Candidatus Saccharimonadales bacterium]
MKVAFHTNQLSIRGTEVAMYDYARYNEEILGNESFILTRHPSVWKYSDAKAIEKFEKRFPVFFYKMPEEIEIILADNKADVFYAQKSGHNDGIISNKIKTVVHAVFQDYEPHGDKYAFISEWLSALYNNAHDFVPYMVTLPDENGDMREELGIPKGAIVYGRHGGYETFDIPYVKHVVVDIAKARPDIYFLFLNTQKFADESIKNIIYLEQIADLNEKTRFINTCDAMLHARINGETFGLAIAEFSLRNKPVITFQYSRDRAHNVMLSSKGIFYSDMIGLKKIINEADFKNKDVDWNCYRQFNPKDVMEKFNKIFLQ